jgi:hypothetical protein
MSDQTQIFCSKKQTAQRYGVATKTIDRWRERKQFPNPAFSTGDGNGRRDYWSVLEQLVPWERSSRRDAE